MSAQDAPTPEQTAPLLGREASFPSILTAIERLPPAGHLELSRSDLVATHSASATSPLLAEAFQLILVLHLLVSEKQDDLSPSRQKSTLDAWHDLQNRGRRRQNLRLLACELLEYLPIAAEDEVNTEGVSKHVCVEDILQVRFSIDSSHSQMMRVIDLLPNPLIPSELLCHPVVTISLVKIWKYGVARPLNSDLPLFQRFLQLYDISAPRTTHAIHLAWHLAYLVLLAHLILYPSPSPMLLNAPGGPIGIREPIIAAYSISNVLFSPTSFSSLPHILILLSFLFTLPASPSPGTIAYFTLLSAFCLHLFSLHFPVSPTPLLLVEPAFALPLSSLYAAFFSRCLFPVFIFFFPVLLASTILLSLSLAQTPFLNVQTFTTPSAAPPAARLTFFGIFSLSFLFLIFFSASIHLLSPSSLPNKDNASRVNWERYGADASLDGRRSLVRAIITYSTSSSRRSSDPVFPPPSNIVSLPLVVFSFRRKVIKIAWRIAVGPLAFLTGGLWFWGLL